MSGPCISLRDAPLDFKGGGGSLGRVKFFFSFFLGVKFFFLPPSAARFFLYKFPVYLYTDLGKSSFFFYSSGGSSFFLLLIIVSQFFFFSSKTSSPPPWSLMVRPLCTRHGALRFSPHQVFNPICSYKILHMPHAKWVFIRKIPVAKYMLILSRY